MNGDAQGNLERGREGYQRRAFADAYRSLAQADQVAPLQAEDLELLAMSAYLIGRDDDYLSALERAHHARLDAGERLPAVRCAFWLGLRLLFRGEIGQATGWLARAKRLLEREAEDCAEHGYLLLPVVEQSLAAKDCAAAYAAATAAAGIGERCGEADLTACARHLQGRVRLQEGRVEEGLALLDEAMVALTGDEVSPLMTGLIYCSVIEACQQVYALGRAREWTAALAQWCEAQPEMVAFTGSCMVHRAEILQLHGAWPAAILEAERACERCRGVNRQAAAAAFYQQAEVYRLRGTFAAAEAGYRAASEGGLEPQPGLALLRLAQGRPAAAAAAIRRALGATTDRLQRTKLLPAYVEIMLATDDVQAARLGCRELEEIAQGFGTDVLAAIAADARGALELAEGNAEGALVSLRRAWQTWQQVEAPYLAARARALIGLACRALGDDDGGGLELDAARVLFERLGAIPDLVRIDSLVQGAASARPHGLTLRELQVLRSVAAGKTNKAIAADLFLSEKTVDRHVSNILTKLDVPSRAAATAFAYRHQLI
jgi:DNA-binding CsgD family transcriptional regulator